MATIDVSKNSGFQPYKVFNTYTLAAAQIGDVINVVKVPKNTRVLSVTLYSAALGASTTLSVGDSGSATRFISAQSTASAATTEWAPTVTTAGYKYTAADTISLTVGGAAATGAVSIVVELLQDFS